MPSITTKLPSHRPYPSITLATAVHRHRARAVPHCELSCHPSPSRSRKAVHCRRAAPSITVKEPSMLAVNPSTAFKSPSLRPLLSIAVESPSCHPSSSHGAVHHHQVAITPSFAVHRHCNHSPSASRSRHPSPSIAADKPSRLPSLSSRHRAVHRCPLLPITVVIAVHHHRHRDRAVPRSIAVKELPHRPSPSRSHRVVH